MVVCYFHSLITYNTYMYNINQTSHFKVHIQLFAFNFLLDTGWLGILPSINLIL